MRWDEKLRTASDAWETVKHGTDLGGAMRGCGSTGENGEARVEFGAWVGQSSRL
jgi:hypothetical protein